MLTVWLRWRVDRVDWRRELTACVDDDDNLRTERRGRATERRSSAALLCYSSSRPMGSGSWRTSIGIPGGVLSGSGFGIGQHGGLYGYGDAHLPCEVTPTRASGWRREERAVVSRSATPAFAARHVAPCARCTPYDKSIFVQCNCIPVNLSQLKPRRATARTHKSKITCRA